MIKTIGNTTLERAQVGNCNKALEALNMARIRFGDDSNQTRTIIAQLEAAGCLPPAAVICQPQDCPPQDCPPPPPCPETTARASWFPWAVAGGIWLALRLARHRR